MWRPPFVSRTDSLRNLGGAFAQELLNALLSLFKYSLLQVPSCILFFRSIWSWLENGVECFSCDFDERRYQQSGNEDLYHWSRGADMDRKNEGQLKTRILSGGFCIKK